MIEYVNSGYWQSGYAEVVNSIISNLQPGRELTDAALSRLTSQFQESYKLKALVEAIVNPIDILLFDVDSIGNNRWIDTSIGKQLDGLGYLVNELRQGRNDDDYRDAIRFRIFVNVSKGTPSALIYGLKFLVDSTDNQYIEQYPATAILFTNGYAVPAGIQSQMQDLAPASISDVPVCVSYTEKPFRFSKTPQPGELFVNGKQDYLTANGADITVSMGEQINGGATLGGIVPSDLFVNEYMLDINGLYSLSVHSENHQVLLDSGYHATGVFQ